MVTVTTTLLHDIEEYFADHNVGPERYPRLHPISLLRRAHELIEDQDDKIITLEEKDYRLRRRSDECTCWRELGDNDDS